MIMTSHPSLLTFEFVWDELQGGVQHILNNLEQGLSNERYMYLYSLIYNYCTKPRIFNGKSPVTHNTVSTSLGAGATNRSRPMTFSTGAAYVGEEIYSNLRTCLKQHCQRLFEVAKEYDKHLLLEYYHQAWHKYTVSARFIHHLCQYLNRHWVKREIEEGHKNIYEIYVLAIVCWKEEIFMPLRSLLTRGLLEWIRCDRNGESIDFSFLRNIISTYVQLGLDELDAKKLVFNVYSEFFENDFIKETQAFYMEESERFLATFSIVQYLKQAESRLAEEERRIDNYLPSYSKERLLSICEKTLIVDHLKRIWHEFPLLLKQDQDEDLARLYKLLHRIPKAIDPLLSLFEDHIKSFGLDSVEAIVDAVDKDAYQYINSLLFVYKKYSLLLTKAFDSDSRLTASFDKACRVFINRNAVCKSSSKSPEFLARYADALLKKSPDNPEEAELERTLNGIMAIFKYFEDKDIFQKFYSKTLAKRLVHGLSASEDAEANMISLLKEACGYEYITKLQRMFTDVGVSKDLNSSFREELAQKRVDLRLDFSIMVLCTGSWPFMAPTTALIVPSELDKCMAAFSNFYLKKHSGRKINWLHQLSKGELKVNYLSKSTFIFQVTTYQMAVLLQFNVKDIYFMEELIVLTGISIEVMRQILGVFVRANVLTVDESSRTASASMTDILSSDNEGMREEEEAFMLTTCFRLNYGFRHKKTRVNLMMQLRSEPKQEQEETHKTIEEDRRILIQATIVRILKTRKTMKFVNLVDEVISQLQSRFQPKVYDIKKSIDILIEKDYIQRTEYQKDMFSYVA